MMRWSIRNQIMFPLLAVAIVSLTTVGAINAVLTEHRTRDQVEVQLRQVIGVLSTSSFPLTNTVLRQMRELSGAEFALADPAGAITATSLPGLISLPNSQAVSRVQDVQLGPSSQVDGRWYFHTVVQLPAGSIASRSGVLHVLFPQDEYRRAWRQAFVPAFLVGAITSLVLAVVAWLVANRMSGAIARLREEVLRIAQGDFRQAPAPAIHDEIHELSAAVNRTAEMLADYEEQVRRSEQLRTLSILGASIAHQLRNAATGCRMALDLHAADCSAADNGESLEVAKRQLVLMESQLQRFLRIGKRPAVIRKQPLDLGDLIEDLLPLVRPAARHAGVALDCQISTQRLIVDGDEEALGQMLLNLLLNAIEAAQQHGVERRSSDSRVCVEVTAHNGTAAHIIISDSGAGVEAAVAGSLFEPFVTSKAEGAGLGLAMAREIVMAHGGQIDWSREGDVTRFQVTIPLTVHREDGSTNRPAAPAGHDDMSLTTAD